MLQNRIYLGETTHKGSSYPGEHEAIVDRELWEKVQKILAANCVSRRAGGSAKSSSLLADDLVPMHADFLDGHGSSIDATKVAVKKVENRT